MINLKFDASELLSGIDNLGFKFDAAVRMFAETNAKYLEGYAKENRKWTDRSGAARDRITGTVEKKLTCYRIILAHGVDYGLWLELANEKKFAIVEPTIRLQGPEVMNNFKDLLNRLG